MAKTLYQQTMTKRITTAKAIGYMKPDIDPQLRLYVPFNEGVGDVAKDYSQYSNHAMLTDVEWNIGKNGGACDFNGSFSLSNCGNDESLNITEALTIESWAKVSNDEATSSYIISKFKQWESADAHLAYGLSKHSGGKWKFKLGNGSTAKEVTSITSISDCLNKWTHIAGTINGTSMKIYINGMEEETGTFSGTRQSNLGIVSIGSIRDVCCYFNGTIDEVRIHNRTLAPAQIAANCYEVVCN